MSLSCRLSRLSRFLASSSAGLAGLSLGRCSSMRPDEEAEAALFGVALVLAAVVVGVIAYYSVTVL